MVMIMEWHRGLHDGIYQFYAYGEDDNRAGIETKLDVTDGKCRELWNRIKEEFPGAANYKGFCETYREAKEESDEYYAREERRYNSFWG